MGSPTAITDLSKLGDTCVSANWVLPVTAPPMANATVAWNGLGTITAVSPARLSSPAPCSNGKQTLLTPGLINTHTHLELTFPHTIPPSPSGDFSHWLAAVIACVQQETAKPNATQLLHQRIATGAQQALSTGTTCVNDITRCLETPSILSAVGLRGVVSWEWFHPAWDVLAIDPIVSAFLQFQQQVSGFPLLKAGLSPHSFYNVSPNALGAVLNACKAHPPWLLHAHVAECTDELAWLQQQPNGFDSLHQQMRGQTFGPQPNQSNTPFHNWLDYLLQHEVLPSQQRWVLAHGAVLQETEWEQLTQWHQQGLPIGVSHCLQSNQWLHQQSIPSASVHPSLHSTGLLSLGTDSPLSSPNPGDTLDLRAEARALHAHHSLSAQQLLTLATTHGAHQLGFGSTIGQLTAGYQADMVLWNVPNHVACNTSAEAYEAWLHPDTTVACVWVNGIQQWPQ